MSSWWLIRALIMFYMVDTLCVIPQTWRVTSVFDFVWNFFRVMPRLSRKRIVSRLNLCRTSSDAFRTESFSVSARASASGSETSHSCHVCSILPSNCPSFLSSLQESKAKRPKNINNVFLICCLLSAVHCLSWRKNTPFPQNRQVILLPTTPKTQKFS